MTITIRPETKTDFDQIRKVIDLAFGQPDEGRLVAKIRELPDFIPELALVAEIEEQVVGHILFSMAEVRGVDQVFEILCLAPMSVLPKFQNQNIGTTLIREGLQRAKALGYPSVTVLGHKDYYPRFGFKPASNWGIKAPFEVSDDVFMVMELEEGALASVSGVVHYAAPFNEL